MSFNIWNDVALYKLWNPKNKILDLNLTKKEKEKKNANRPRPYLLLFLSHGPKKKKKDWDHFVLSFSLSSWPYRTTKYISAIDREIKWKKRKTTSTGPIPPHAVDIWLMIFN